MSYREIKNVTDVLRRMGYPRLISLESFRTPNFQLLGDILRWFLKRHDPTSISDTPSDLGTEAGRVNFIRYFVQNILRKTGVRLNGRRLYQADGYAVKEIAKLIQFYSTAKKELDKDGDTGQTGHKDHLTQFYQLQPSLHKVKVTRDLSASLTDKGVTFFDLVTKEAWIGSARDTLLAKPFELRDYDSILAKATEAMKKEEKRLRISVDSAVQTQGSLDLKIEKKRQELERSQQRLQTMAKVRPAYMDDLDKVTRELEDLYTQYVERFRILAHLQHQMEEMGVQESQRSAKLGSTNAYSSQLDDLSGSEEEESLEMSLEQLGREDKVKVKGVGADQGMRGRSSRGKSGAQRVNMYGGLEEEESESETDMVLIDGDNSDLGSDMDDDVDIMLSMRNGPYGNKEPEAPRVRGSTHPIPSQNERNLMQSLSTGDEDLLDDPYVQMVSRPMLTGSAKVKGGGPADSGDSLTKPLRPDPRYSSNGRIGVESGRQSGRPTTNKLRGRRQGEASARPQSRVNHLLHELNEEDLE